MPIDMNIRMAVDSAIVRQGSRIIDIAPIVETMGRFYPQFSTAGIEERILQAVRKAGGAIEMHEKNRPRQC